MWIFYSCFSGSLVEACWLFPAMLGTSTKAKLVMRILVKCCQQSLLARALEIVRPRGPSEGKLVLLGIVLGIILVGIAGCIEAHTYRFGVFHGPGIRGET